MEESALTEASSLAAIVSPIAAVPDSRWLPLKELIDRAVLGSSSLEPTLLESAPGIEPLVLEVLEELCEELREL